MTRIWTSFATCIIESDLDKEQLHVQLQLLGANFDVVTADVAMNILHVNEYSLSIGQGHRLLMSQVVALLQFILVIPTTNVTSIIQCDASKDTCTPRCCRNV